MSDVAPNQDRTAILYGLGAVALWSTVATAFKVALSYMSPLELIWLASVVSWLLMGALVIHQGLLKGALCHGWRTAAWAGCSPGSMIPVTGVQVPLSLRRTARTLRRERSMTTAETPGIHSRSCPMRSRRERTKSGAVIAAPRCGTDVSGLRGVSRPSGSAAWPHRR